MSFYYSSILLGSIFIFTQNVLANMILSQNIIYFDSENEDYHTIQVSNFGKDTLYIEAQPSLVMDPGSDQEQRITSKNPRDIGLYISPKKFKLTPSSKRFVRISSLKRHLDKDLIYRIKFNPVVGDITAKQSGLKILIAYEALVLVQPKLPRPDLFIEQRGSGLWLENKGNTNILLSQGSHCLADSQCINLPSKRLYSGQHIEINLEHTAPVNYRIKIGQDNDDIVFQPKPW